MELGTNARSIGEWVKRAEAVGQSIGEDERAAPTSASFAIASVRGRLIRLIRLVLSSGVATRSPAIEAGFQMAQRKAGSTVGVQRRAQKSYRD